MPNPPATQSVIEGQLDQSKTNLPNERHKLRDVNITQALTYPFLRQNRVNALLLPVVQGALSAVLSMLGVFLWKVFCPTYDTAGATDFLSSPSGAYFVAFCMFLFFSSLMGYGWRLILILRNNGYDAPAPDWTLEAMMVSWLDGMKLMLLIAVLPLTVCFVVVIGSLPQVDNIIFDRCSTASNEASGHETSTTSELLTKWDSDASFAAMMDETKYQADLERYSEAIRVNPNDWEARSQRGYAYLKLGRQSEAINDYSEVIRLNPKNNQLAYLTAVAAYDGRGSAYLELRQYRKAISDYSKDIGIAPGDWWAYRHRGAAYWSLRQPREAIEDFGKAIRIDPTDAQMFLLRGAALYDSGEFQKAIADYSHAIHLEPKNATAYFYRGDAYRKLRQRRNEIEDFTKSISLDSTDLKRNARTHRKLTDAYLETVQCLKAVEAYSKAYVYYVYACTDLDKRALIISGVSGVVLCVLIMPFLMGAIVQSSESRACVQLLNLSRILRSGTRCYGKALLVSMSSLLLIILLVGAGTFLISQGGGEDTKLTMMVATLVLFVLTFVSTPVTNFHLLAQAYDEYREK